MNALDEENHVWYPMNPMVSLVLQKKNPLKETSISKLIGECPIILENNHSPALVQFKHIYWSKFDYVW